MAIVKGHTGLLSPINLATNGSFRINQRGWSNSLARAKVNDYVADGWYISAAPDYVEAANTVAGGVCLITMSGYGRVGQTITLLSKDNQPYAGGGGVGDTLRQDITAVVDVLNGGVPISVEVLPRYHSAGVGTTYSKVLTLNAGGYGRAVKVLNTLTYAINQAGYILITLQQDGAFNFTIQHYAELVGSYQNPPRISPVPYAEDLARCQRYYQVGSAYIFGKAIKTNTDAAFIAIGVTLPTEMAGNANPVAVANDVLVYDGAASSSDRKANTTVTATEGSPRKFVISLTNAEGTYAAQMYTNGLSSRIDWTASV